MFKKRRTEIGIEHGLSRLKEKTANREGYSQTQIHGSLRKTDDYPSCSLCGSKGFYLCYKCNKVVCWNGTDSNGVCPWCGVCSSINIVDQYRFETAAELDYAVSEFAYDWYNQVRHTRITDI